MAAIQSTVKRSNYMRLTTLPAVAAGLCLFVAVPGLHASEWNQKTTMTFNQAVEVPGRVLSPGTYVFKLQNSQSDRDIVQIYTKNMRHMIGTYLTVPDYRMKTPGKTIVNFRERAEGSPEAIKVWFYPGNNFGHEFVYPRTEATKLAKANNEAVPYMEDNEYNGSNMTSGHVRAMKPGGEAVEVIEIFGPAPQNTSSNGSGQQTNGNSSNGRSHGSQAHNSNSGSGGNQGQGSTSTQR
jgi:hypothetical protein